MNRQARQLPSALQRALLVLVTIVLLQGCSAEGAEEPVAHDGTGWEDIRETRWDDINRRFGQALERNRNLPVVYEDILGEGPESWDPDPRYPNGSVNCVTWLYLLLAETYSDQPEERHRVMDRIRYYDGHIGFGFRKHFTDQWMALDPKPLSRVDLSHCTEVDSHHVVLEPQTFASNVNYSCPLYHSNERELDVPNVSSSGLVKCAGSLRPGYYIAFPLAGPRYLDRYGAKSGPMAQVHAVVLQVPPSTGKSPDAADVKVYHASIGKGRVVETNLESYVWDMTVLFRGYAVYALDPDWDWRSTRPLDEEGQAVQACEETLQGRVGEIFEASAAPRIQ